MSYSPNLFTEYKSHLSSLGVVGGEEVEKRVSQVEEIRTTQEQVLLCGANGLIQFPINVVTVIWAINELLRTDVRNNLFSL